MAKDDIVISPSEKGISSSYMGEFANIQHIDTSSAPGAAFVNYKTMQVSPVSGSLSVSSNFAQDLFTTSENHGYETGNCITFTTSGTLPSPLAEDTYYYVIRVSDTTFRVATTLPNAQTNTYVDFSTINVPLDTTISLVQMQQVVKILRDPKANGVYNKYWLLDEDGVIWVNYENNIWSPVVEVSGARNIEIWEDYLIIFRATQVGYIGALSNYYGGGSTTDLTWQTDLETASEYYSLVSSNGFLYNGGGKYVSSLSKTVGSTFDPTSGASFTWEAQALDLPENTVIKSIAELGGFLMLGTEIAYEGGTSSFIYTWDKVSTTYENPLDLKERSVGALIGFNGLVYAMAGGNGSIYVTNSTSVSLFKRFPQFALGIQQSTSEIDLYQNAITRVGTKMYFGVSTGVPGDAPAGVYSVDIDTGELVIEHTISTGEDGSENDCRITALLAIDDTKLLIGWRDGNTYGLDNIDVTDRHDTGKVLSGLKRVGTKRSPRTYKTCEVQLSKPLPGGTSVVVKYRENVTDNFTTYGTFSSAGITSEALDRSIVVENLQVLVEMNTNGLNTPELIEVRMY